MAITITTVTTQTEISIMNEMIDESINSVIQEAVNHFNQERRRVKNPDDDCRFFWNDDELNLFLKQVKYPEKVWVSTVYDDNGKFYAYRVGRIIINKKKKEIRY